MGTSSKFFLVVLLLATVTCILVLQSTLDVPAPPHSQLSISQANSQEQISEQTISPDNFPEITRETMALNTTTTTSVPTIAPRVSQLLVPSRPTPKPSYRNDSLHQKRIPLNIGQVKQLGIGRIEPGPTFYRKNNVAFINPQAKLREIIKRRTVMQDLPKALKAVRALPTIKQDDVIRVFLITYFRSGSSFVGDLLQQNWKTFYQFEPLHYMTYDSRIPDSRTKEAFQLLSNLYHCQFDSLTEYFNWARRTRNQFLFAHSLFLWFSCRTNNRMCFYPEFVSAVCQRAPVQVIKATRVHMYQLEQFLNENPDLKIKVVYLTRDPRGIVSSRRSLDWCNGTDCSNPNVLCREMDNDLSTFERLRASDPSNFVHVRYEDIAMDPQKEAKKLFEFLKLPFSISAQRFLKSHTIAKKTDNLDPYSTKRNSSSMAFSWHKRLTFEQVQIVQNACSNVIRELGFSFIKYSKDLRAENVSLFDSSSNKLDVKTTKHYYKFDNSKELPDSSLSNSSSTNLIEHSIPSLNKVKDNINEYSSNYHTNLSKQR